MATPSSNLETLCDKEFDLLQKEAYHALDREVIGIRNHFASLGHARSSVVGQSVVDAVLARYDRVLIGFEQAYLSKWAETDRELSDTDCEWLRTKATSVLSEAAREAQTKCQSLLYEPSLFFQGWWQKAGFEALGKNQRILDKIEILRLQKGIGVTTKPASPIRPASIEPAADVWDLLHQKVVAVARTRFESGHYTDAAEAAFKEINDTIRKLVKQQTGKEYDGAALMQVAFSAQNPVLKLDDLGEETGRSIQVGYMQIFSGAMTGIRNPKAHSNVNIDATRALHFLFLASLLFSKLDERIP